MLGWFKHRAAKTAPCGDTSSFFKQNVRSQTLRKSDNWLTDLYFDYHS